MSTTANEMIPVAAGRYPIDHAMDQAVSWARANDQPLHVGEFGAFKAADMASRARWTEAVQTAAPVRGMSTSYWEFNQSLGAYDRNVNDWREPLLDALLD